MSLRGQLAACWVLATVTACGADDSGPTYDPAAGEWEPRGVAGTWFAGDLHVHATGASNDTGGDSFPADIKAMAIARGLDFIVLTDHSNSTGSDVDTTDEDPAKFNLGPEFPYWAQAAMLTDDAFLMVDGNELSPVADELTQPRGHVGCYPRDLATFDPTVAFTDRPKSDVTGAQTLAQARAAGCFTTINHPFGVTPWIAWDWTSRDYDALEVWNGTAGFDFADLDAARAWACDLAAGKRVVAVGGSDNHRVDTAIPGDLLNPPLGQPKTWVFAASLTWPAIIAGLDAARVAVTDGQRPLELDVYRADGRWLAMSGGDFSAADAAWLRVRGDLRSDAFPRTLTVYSLAAAGCDDRRAAGTLTVPVPAETALFTRTVAEGEVFDEAIAVQAAAGDVFYARVVVNDRPDLGTHGAALSNAVLAR